MKDHVMIMSGSSMDLCKIFNLGKATVYHYRKRAVFPLNLAACDQIVTPEQLNGHIFVPCDLENVDKDEHSTKWSKFKAFLNGKKLNPAGEPQVLTDFISKRCKAVINKDLREDLENGKTVYGIKKGEPDKRAEFVRLYPTRPNDAVNRNDPINGLHPHGPLVQANKLKINGTDRYEYKDVEVIGSYSVEKGKITTVLFSEVTLDEKRPDSADDGKTEPKTKTSLGDGNDGKTGTEHDDISKREIDSGDVGSVDEDKDLVYDKRGKEGKDMNPSLKKSAQKCAVNLFEKADFPSLPKPGDKQHHSKPSKQGDNNNGRTGAEHYDSSKREIDSGAVGYVDKDKDPVSLAEYNIRKNEILRHHGASSVEKAGKLQDLRRSMNINALVPYEDNGQSSLEKKIRKEYNDFKIRLLELEPNPAVELAKEIKTTLGDSLELVVYLREKNALLEKLLKEKEKNEELREENEMILKQKSDLEEKNAKLERLVAEQLQKVEPLNQIEKKHFPKENVEGLINSLGELSVQRGDNFRKRTSLNS